MIDIRNLNFNYKSQEENRLRDVSLQIKQGECVLLCGASGCGKTIIIAEHRTWYLMDIVDKVVFMEKGEIKNEYTISDFLSLKNSESLWQ